MKDKITMNSLKGMIYIPEKKESPAMTFFCALLILAAICMVVGIVVVAFGPKFT